ncbi:hypothetical protein HDU93_006180, partial [Gonapodya sp. JEL0774]
VAFGIPRFFDDPSFLRLYPSLVPSFVHLRFSPLVSSAARRLVAELFHDTPVSRVLALHLRRGDFKSHCGFVTERRLSWTGANTLVDSTFDPLIASPDEFRRRCYPTSDETADVILKAIRWSHSSIEAVYVATDASALEVRQLAAHLPTGTVVKSTRDACLRPEEKHVAVAIDMEIAENAGVFVGNG